jgi:hypothetical protein
MRTLNFYNNNGVLKYSLESDKPLAQIKTHSTYYYLELDKLYLVESEATV